MSSEEYDFANLSRQLNSVKDLGTCLGDFLFDVPFHTCIHAIFRDTYSVPLFKMLGHSIEKWVSSSSESSSALPLIPE